MRRDSSGSPQSFLDGGRSIPELDAFPASPGPLLFLPLLFVQAGGMDLSKVGEKLLSSVRSARSLGLLPGPSDRPEVPARAAAAAVVAHALAGLPPHQRINLPSSSDGLVSAYSSRKHGETVEELEEEFYEEEFDPVRYLIETLPSEESDSTYFEKKSTLRLAQLDKILERLSRHVMEHHEKMVKGMQLVMELEQDLKVANVICMNGRRHITSSMNEVSRDLVVHTKSRKKQALLDMLPILAELRHAVDMQTELETLIEKGRYCQAFQLLPEYLQILDNYSGLSAIQEMGRDIEAWLARTIQKLDAHLLGVCQAFNEQSYITAVDAYALMGDIAGLAEKIQSFFMQEVLSQTHSILKDLVQEEIGNSTQRSRLTYSDLCTQIPESKFRQCLLKTLDTLFKLMCSYFSIMIFQSEDKKGLEIKKSHVELMQDGACRGPEDKKLHDSEPSCSSDPVLQNGHAPELSNKTDGSEVLNNKRDTHESGTLGAIHYSSSTSVKASEGESSVLLHDSPFHQLRKDATMFVRHTLEKGRRNMWQLTTSRVSALLSSSAVGSSSTYQFLRNYEDLNTFILAGEGFCGVEAVDFRQKLRSTCESYVASFHHQNVYALKMVLEKESWVKISAETIQITSLAGLIGDGAPLVVPSLSNASISILDPRRYGPIDNDKPNNGFSYWIRAENPFSSKFACEFKESPISQMSPNGLKSSSLADGNVAELSHSDKMSTKDLLDNHLKPSCSAVDDENEDLLADFIDEDSQLPSRVLKPMLGRTKSSSWNDEEASAQTGSSLCLLRLMDKYARLMQKLEIVNLEFFKGMCQLFGIFYYYIFEAFGHRDANQSGKSLPDLLSPRLKMALSKILQDCDQWIRSTNMSYSPSSPISLSPAFAQMEVLPTIPPSTMLGHVPSTSFGLKARCDGVETISLVARVLNRSRAHLQSMLLQHNAGLVEEFYNNLVDTVPDLAEHIHRTTARMLLHINGYADKIANAKWEVKELGLEHNGYVDLLLGEFKHYKTRLVHGGISKEVQDILLEYGLESVAETLTEGLSRVKRCTDEGRVLMSLDLQVLINGLQHFAANVKPKLQIVETFIKAYYLPETEYVHWARSHPEYSRSQIVGLINLVAAMKGWKRKTRVEAIEKIEA